MAREKKVKNPLAPRVSKVTKPTMKAKKSKAKIPEKTYKSADLVTQSDDEDMDDAPAVSTMTTKPTNGAKSESSEDDESGSGDSDTDAGALSKEASKNRIEQLAEQDDSEDEGSDSESESDEDDENIEEQTSAPTPIRNPIADSPPPRPIASGSKAPITTNGRIDNDIDDSELRPIVEFKAPSGFKPIKGETISSQTVDMFQPENTKGKEIWYISAPASLPITALKEVALEKVAKQQAIMTHDGEHYALVSDPAARDSTRVLMPEEKNGYKVVPTPVKHVLQFQQILSVQATATKGRPKATSQVLLDTDLPTKPHKKAQPKGMKMRFRPSGFGSGELGHIGSSDEEDLPRPAAFRQPPGLPSRSTPSNIREEPDSVLGQDKLEMKKKKKDKKKEKNKGLTTAEDIAEKNATYVAEATTAIDSDQETAPPEAQASEGRKKKKKEKKNKDRQGVEVATGLEPDDETMNGETITVNEEYAPPEEGSNEKKEKKKRKEAEADARTINRSALEVETPAEAADEVSEKKKKKKEKKEKKAA